MRLVQFVLLSLSIAVPFYASEDVVWIPARIVSIDYPLLALQSRTHGEVKVRCTLTTDGSVSNAEVLAGPALLGRSVLARIGEWRFRVSHGAGSEHRATVILSFNFVLEKPVVAHPKTKFIYEYPYNVTIVSEPLFRTH